VFRLIEGPILVRFALPPLLNSFVGLLKLATLSSAIGVQEIIFQGEQQIQQHFEVVNVSVTIIAIYVIFTIPITRLTARLEARLRGPAVT
jgi:ABC-type amino acid transport system permease subunit